MYYRYLFTTCCVRHALLDTRHLRYFSIENLILTNLFSTVVAVITLALSTQPTALRNATIAGLILLWSAFPLGMWGVLKGNRGVTAIYVLYGLVVIMMKIAVITGAAVMMAASCQMEQSSFQGCGVAVVDELPCLANSTCSRDMINAYNDVANVTCEAWSTDDCNSAPSSRTSMGFTPMQCVVFTSNIFSFLIPVAFAFVYYIRLEAGELEQWTKVGTALTPFVSVQSLEEKE